MLKTDKIILNLIENFKGFDCSLIVNDKNYILFKKNLLDFLNKRNLKVEDLAIVSSGIYSSVYEINNYIIKIGVPTKSNCLVNNSNIINVYLKEDYIMDNGEKPLYLRLEIQDKAKTNAIIDDKVIGYILESLYKEGYIWADAKAENIGFYNNKYVIIDTDFIFKKEDKNIELLSEMSKKFINKINGQ